jgi:hypothetical protein
MDSDNEDLAEARRCMGWGDMCENCGDPMGSCSGCEGCEEFLSEAVHAGCLKGADDDQPTH